MNRIVTIAILSLAVSGLAFADGEQTQTHTHDHATPTAMTPSIDVPAAAKEAVAAVDRFSTALSAGRLDAAGAELAGNVLILESGGAERSAAEYLAGHAKGDVAFLKGVHIQLRHRTAKVSGDLVWVGTESELHGSKDGKPLTTLSTETMIVQRVDNTWKIVHIHWSSRMKKPAAPH